MSNRKQEILTLAVEIIASEGYASLTMRALARASGIKLGALQYHFPTFEDMLRALVGHISDTYNRSFAALLERDKPSSIRDIVMYILDDEAGDALGADYLWPQLWAMQQVEPLVSDLMEELYSNYYAVLTAALKRDGCAAPEAEALALMSLLEGTTIFMGEGRRWANQSKSVRKVILEIIDQRYAST